MYKRIRNLLMTSVALAGMSMPAAAGVIITGTGTGVNPTDVISAQASFQIVGNLLMVGLINTSPNNTDVPGNQLTGLFFNLPTLSTVGATAFTAAGSTVVGQANCNAACNGNPQNVGGEWAYGANVSGTVDGISSSGYGLFGAPNLNGTNLQDPAAVDGLQFGLMSAANNYADGNGGVQNNALVQSAVAFTFPVGTLTDADLAGITGVRFQFGTSLEEPSITVTQCVGCTINPLDVPEPASMALLGSGVFGLGLALRRRRRVAA